jgi:hypothetical protein
MEGVIGSTISPKTFPASPKFGASAQPQIVTQAQPLALNSGTQTPAASGYRMNPATSPAAQPVDTGAGTSQDFISEFRVKRGDRQPFYGQIF